ncbi:MAG: GNAT family N-acetyltransferase [Bacteroidales bacterium]|nr:GNAT family N-acetyltransferase [Bacteroidales bacterium]MDD4822050.1 GNAT family N-acetyltransferase [Bacteroidales bacterium]
MPYRIQNTCEGIDFKEVVRIIKTVGMKYHDPDVQEKAFRNSASTIFIFDNEILVGFGRAISDGVSQAAIYDVAIQPSYQGKGWGKMVIQKIREELSGYNLILYASPGKEDFYRKNGFFKMRTAMAYFEDAESRRAKGFIE